jgi:hypothetical protein
LLITLNKDALNGSLRLIGDVQYAAAKGFRKPLYALDEHIGGAFS